MQWPCQGWGEGHIIYNNFSRNTLEAKVNLVPWSPAHGAATFHLISAFLKL